MARCRLSRPTRRSRTTPTSACAGRGATLAEAFANAGRALTAVVTDPASVREALDVEVTCEAADPDALLFDWLNALVFEIGDAPGALRSVRGRRSRAPRSTRARVRRAGRRRAPPPGGRGEGRDVDGAARRAARDGVVGRRVRRGRVRAKDHGPLAAEAPLRVRVGIEPHGKMRVPGVLFASEPLVRAMDHKVYEQVTNVATLPGIGAASMAMPDAHWGYGFAVGRRRGVRSRRGRRLGGRRRLRHLVRRALPAHAAARGRTSRPEEGRSRTRSSARSRPASAAAAASGSRRGGDGRAC